MKPAYTTGRRFIHFFLPAPPNQKIYWVGDYNHWECRRALRYSEKDGGYNFRLPAQKDGIYFYKYVVNGNWMLDPRNPRSIPNGPFGTNSCALMPGYRFPREVQPDFKVPRGKVEALECKGTRLRKPREIYVYRPPHTSDSEELPLIVLQDGRECVEHLPLPDLFDKIIAQKICRPFMAVMVSPLGPQQRDQDYIFNDTFEDFLPRDLIKLVRERYGITKNRKERAILGWSLGGLVSVRCAIRHPDVYGLAGGESSAFWPRNGRIYEEVIHQTPLSTSFYLGCGDMDGGEQLSMLMAEIFGHLGIHHKLKLSNGGHEWFYWRTHLRHSLAWFFPQRP